MSTTAALDQAITDLTAGRAPDPEAGRRVAELAPEPTPCAAKPKDGTGAERQRRRRARQKDEPTRDIDRDVTPENRDIDRDTVTETVTGDGQDA